MSEPWPEGWTGRVEALLRAAVPDLLGVPVYIVPFSVLDDERLAGHRYDNAWTAPWADLMLRPELERLGRWQGRGFATVVRDEKATLRTEYHRAAVAIHEAAHWLACTSRFQSTPIDELPELYLWAASEPRDSWGPDKLPEPAEEQQPPWKFHGPRWIRACLHVAHRASQIETLLTLPMVKVAGEFYGLSPAHVYVDALGSELHERRGRPIRELLETLPPEKFIVQWLDDTKGEGRWDDFVRDI